VQESKALNAYRDKFMAAGAAGYGAGEGGAPAGDNTQQQDAMLYGEPTQQRKMGGTNQVTAPTYTPAYTSYDQYGAIEHPAVGTPPAAQTTSTAKTSVSTPTTTTTTTTQPTSMAATSTQDQEPTYSGGKIGGRPAGLVLREMRAKAMEDFKAGKGPEPFSASKSEKDYTQYEVAKTGFDARKSASPADATMGPSMDMGKAGSLLMKPEGGAAAVGPPPNFKVPTSVGTTTIEATKAKNPLYDAVGGIAESARPFNTARLIASKVLPAASNLADTFAIGRAGEAFKLGGQLAGMQGHVADTATDIAKLTKDLGVANKGVTAAESGVTAAKATQKGISNLGAGLVQRSEVGTGAEKILKAVDEGLLKPEEISKAASRGVSAAKNAVETAKGAANIVDETIAGTTRAGEMAKPFLAALEKAAPAAQRVAQFAAKGANILRPLAPVARVAGKLALPLQIGMEALDTGRFFKDQEFQDKTIKGMEDFGNQGRQAFGEGGTLGQKAAYVGSALEQGLTPMKTLLALGAQSTKMRGSMEDAARAEAGATTAQNRFQATQDIINQPNIQEQLKGMPFGSKERVKFLQDIRKRVQVK
jgi:hypothetical protein